VQRRVGGIPVITLLGFGNLILFSMVLYSAFKLPAFSGPTGTDAVLFVIGVYLAGVVWYLVARALNKRRGVDLDLLYREIPPE
jgi:hypothetical protein